MALPNSPSNGQIVTVGTKNWIYRATSDRWEWIANFDYASPILTWRTVTASTTLTEADANNGIIFDSASNLTLTIPTGLAGAYRTGMSTAILGHGAGTVTLIVTGITVYKKPTATLVLNGVNAQASLSKLSLNTFALVGDLV